MCELGHIIWPYGPASVSAETEKALSNYQLKLSNYCMLRPKHTYGYSWCVSANRLGPTVTFQPATDPSGNQIVAASGKYQSPFRQTRRPSSVDGRLQWASCLTPCSHYMRPLTDGGFLMYPCVFPGCITKAISLDSVLANICITQSDWPTDSSLPEKLNISKLFDSGHGADRTDMQSQ